MVRAEAGKKLIFFLLLVFVMDLATAEKAEARRRCFGRRSRGVSARNRNFNRFNFNNFNSFAASNGFFNNPFSRFSGFNNARVNINDPFGLARFPADVTSSLQLDPTGGIQRLAIAPNIGVDRFGRFFELNGNSLDVRQQLAFSNGQFFGGLNGRVSQDVLDQMRLVNDSGNFDVLPFR